MLESGQTILLILHSDYHALLYSGLFILRLTDSS